MFFQNDIVVTKTSGDPKMVALIREHARKVSSFLKEGMPCMMGFSVSTPFKPSAMKQTQYGLCYTNANIV